MDAITAMLTRRSIRKYTAEPVPDEVLNDLLQCAMHAPSAGNQQPWHFVIIRDRKILDAVPGFHPHAAMLKNAPVAVLICADTALETHKGYWMVDCSAATQNFLLATHAKGLGAVWLGIYPREERMAEIKSLLDLPTNVMPLSLVALGYPAEAKLAADRFNSSRLHYDKW
ncbi:MAG: nitroreductase family protein [Nitrospiraceae bacterium]|nr:nitroreductase family protein [Nitrospiraceae bacterium]